MTEVMRNSMLTAAAPRAETETGVRQNFAPALAKQGKFIRHLGNPLPPCGGGLGWGVREAHRGDAAALGDIASASRILRDAADGAPQDEVDHQWHLQIPSY